MVENPIYHVPLGIKLNFCHKYMNIQPNKL